MVILTAVNVIGTLVVTLVIVVIRTDLVNGVMFVNPIPLANTVATFAGNQDVMEMLVIVVTMSISCADTIWSANTTGKLVPTHVKILIMKVVNLVTVVIVLNGANMV